MSYIDPVLEGSRRAIRKGSRSFDLAARLLAAEQRHDAVLLYAWCRHCDDIIDGQTLGFQGKLPDSVPPAARLEGLRQATRRALESDEPVADPFEALRRVARRHDIPMHHPLEHIAGFQMDVVGRRYRSIEDTLDYAYHVAGVVGLMMAMVLGVRDNRTLSHAVDLGIAFQLTNIARDLVEDCRAGRCYVPHDWLVDAGIADGIDPESDEEIDRLLVLANRLLATAEPYYDSALEGIGRLPGRSAWAIAAARRIYREIGAEIQKGGVQALRRRASVSKPRKLLLIMSSLRDVTGAQRRR